MKPCMYASSGNKHFFAKSCHRQTYQNYEQSRQKLGTFLENKVISKTFYNKSWSSRKKRSERFDQFFRQKNDSLELCPNQTQFQVIT